MSYLLNQKLEKSTIIFISKLINITWKLILATGGFFIIFFFIFIRFLPELDLTSSLSLFVAASIVGSTLLLFLFLSATIGGFIIFLLFQETNQKQSENMTVSMTILSAVTTCVYVFLLSFKLKTNYELISPIFLFVTILIILFFITSCFFKQERRKNSNKLGLFRFVTIAVLIFAISTAHYLFQALVFLSMYKESAQTPLEIWHSVIIFLWILLQIFSINVIAFSSDIRELLKRAAVTGFINLIILSTITNNPTFLFMRVAQMLSLGSIHNTYLLVTDHGCDILNSASNGSLCIKNQNQTSHISESVTILSRIGKQHKIGIKEMSLASEENEKLMYTFTIPSSEILGFKKFIQGNKDAPKKNSDVK